MTSTTPFYVTVANVPPGLEIAYRDWAEHWRTCEQCQEHDWYNPGDVSTVLDPLLADGWIVVSKGRQKPEKVYYRVGPDYTLLCAEGRRAHRLWCKQAALYETVRYGRLGG